MNTTPFAQKYGWKSANEACSHPYLLPLAVGICRKHGTKRLLDIGTGNGHALHTWMHEGWETAAMEPDADGYAFARQISGADVRRLGVGDPMPEDWLGAFDTVVSLEVVEHLFNPFQLVETAASVLQPGGIALISIPYHGYLKNLLLSLANKWDFHHHPLRLGGHIKFWSRPTLQALFQKGPFRLVEFHGAGRMPYLWKSMFMVFEKLP